MSRLPRRDPRGGDLINGPTPSETDVITIPTRYALHSYAKLVAARSWVFTTARQLTPWDAYFGFNSTGYFVTWCIVHVLCTCTVHLHRHLYFWEIFSSETETWCTDTVQRVLFDGARLGVLWCTVHVQRACNMRVL